MLASRLPGILPSMTEDEALESAALQSLVGGFDPARWKARPYRAPHHTASAVALVGGSSSVRPGEVSLAHRGVLFLDELPEFERRVLEVLREPLESGSITISRAARQAQFPARFQLVAAMNPCPCGYFGHQAGRCRCTPDMVNRYQGRISGPLLDRIDLQVQVGPLAQEELLAGGSGESSDAVRCRVEQCARRQILRQGGFNAALAGAGLEGVCHTSQEGEALLRSAMSRLGWSARAYHRVLKVARTIADLAGDAEIGQVHVAEAIQYRRALRHD
jgi:magnesium chelatase family protein